MDAAALSRAHAVVARFVRTRPMVHYPTLFFTPEYKRAAHALYAFFRTADDLVDEARVPPEEFRAWRAQSRLPVERQSDPFLLAWADVRARYAIDPAYEESVLDGLESDLTCRRYATLDELACYCRGVAGAPLLLAMSVAGFGPAALAQARPYLEHIGTALQLTNILRDVGADLACGRIYLPAAELAAFGLTCADIEARCCDERFKRCMQHLSGIARAHYSAGWPVLELWPPSFRLAGGFGFILYRSILDELEARGFEVFAPRRKTPVWKMFGLLAAKWPAICWTGQAERYFR